jgi:hypothetical protein
MCTKKFTKYRNLALEKIIVKLKYPCKYGYLGCTGLFSLDCLASHQENCPRRAHRCPVEVMDGNTCAWEGPEDAILDHVMTSHGAFEVCEDPEDAIVDHERTSHGAFEICDVPFYWYRS